MTNKQAYAGLLERLLESCIDWTGEPIVDGSTPRYELTCGDIRKAADRIEQLEAELRLWLILVNEGGVPRYTVTPGAALNTVVTSTKRLVA